MRLCYRGLFRLDDHERLRLDLLESAEWSSDHLQLRLTLREGLKFSDQTPLTAEDAAMSILYRRYYLQKANGESEPPLPADYFFSAENGGTAVPSAEDPAAETTAPAENLPEESGVLSGFPLSEQSEYFHTLGSDPSGLQSLQAIESILALDSRSFVISLAERAERLPFVLNFAVIPAEYAEAESGIPGCGSYRIVKIEDDLSLHLTATEQTDAPGLEIWNTGNEESALEWFAEGKLDVLLLDEESFYERSLRQDLFFIRQETLTYRYFTAGSSPDCAFSREDVQRAFRAWLKTWPGDSPIRGNQLLPLHSRDWRAQSLQNPPLSRETSSPLAALSSMLEGYTLRLAAPASSYSRMVMDKLAERLSPLKCELSITFVPQEEYENFARNGVYDLLFGEYELSYPIDPIVLRNGLQQRIPSLSLNLPALTDDQYLPPLFIYRFDLNEEEMLSEKARLTLQKYADSFAESSVFSAGFSEQGVILAQWVSGHLSSPAWDPYRGIEDLRCLD